MCQRVAILGGGVAGLSAAHELAERGFQVVVYETKCIPGGKARSLPVPDSGTDGRPDLPAEHGFRFFPGFYRHLPDTMMRIPYRGGRTVHDNLVAAERTQLARIGQNAILIPARFPQRLSDLYLAFRFLFGFEKTFGIPRDEIRYFIRQLLVLMTSCEERRFATAAQGGYDHISWWDFIDAANKSPAYQNYLADGLTRSLVALRPQLMSTRTGGYILLQFLYDFSTPGTQVDRVLNGPTNDVWIDPWLDHLGQLGVDYRRDVTVEAIQCANNLVTGVTIRENGQSQQVTADYYLAAVPVEAMAPLATPAMMQAEPRLARLDRLKRGWMNGILFFLNRDIPIVHGHTNYCDSPWALTSISQKQFWPGVDLSRFGAGNVQGILSAIVSDWDRPGVLCNKPAKQCTREEIEKDVWEQIKRHHNSGQTLLEDRDLVTTFLAPSIEFEAPSNPQNREQLLINTTGSWDDRPEAVTRIPNFFLAADYVRAHTDLATMETANEAARRAVNGILIASRSTARRCSVWPLKEPVLFAPQRWADRQRFRLGRPHRLPLDIIKGAIR